MVTFVKDTDFLTQISKDELNIICEQATSGTNSQTWSQIMADVNKAATDIINTKIGQIYDVTDEFTKVAYDRNYQLLTWAIFICLYLIYQRCGDYAVPDRVIKNWDDTQNELMKISQGKEPLNLPRVQDSQDDSLTYSRRIGYEPKRSHTM